MHIYILFIYMSASACVRMCSFMYVSDYSKYEIVRAHVCVCVCVCVCL